MSEPAAPDERPDAVARLEARRDPRAPRGDALQRHLAALGVVALSVAAGAGLRAAGLDDAVDFLHLLAVVVVAYGLGPGPAVLAAVLGVGAHAFFFVPPVFGFPAIGDTRAWWTLATLLLVALVVGTLTSRLRRHAAAAEARARRADALRALSRDLSAAGSPRELLDLAAARVGDALGGRVLVLPAGDGRPGPPAPAGPDGAPDEAERDAAARAVAERRAVDVPGGRGTAGPLVTERAAHGALVLRRDAPLATEDRTLLERASWLVAEALERAVLAETAQQAAVEARTERLRNALLSSVSHDFRTPLAVIVAATTHLVARGDAIDAAERADLARAAEHEAQRLDRIVNDLLAMTRLDADAVRAVKEWQPLEDVVGAAMGRMERTLAGRPVSVSLPAGLPLVPLDAVLVEQALVNLLDNACKHTPEGSAVEVSARASDGEVVVEVADRGPGIPPGEEEAVFDRFRRGSGTRAEGVGLGLAVSRGIVAVHGGRLWAENRPQGGAAFRLTLPLDGSPPAPPPAEDAAGERT